MHARCVLELFKEEVSSKMQFAGRPGINAAIISSFIAINAFTANCLPLPSVPCRV